MSGHTPVPWEYVVDDDGETIGAAIIIRMGTHLRGRNGWEPQHRIEYQVSAPDESPEQFAEAEANARLIAAAPDLLAALKALVVGVERDDNPSDQGHCEHSDEMNAARAAIAKAEGRS